MAKLDNEVATTVEMIISRYAYALGTLKSTSGHVHQFRDALAAGKKDVAKGLGNDVNERITNAAIRIYKLAAVESILLVGLA